MKAVLRGGTRSDTEGPLSFFAGSEGSTMPVSRERCLMPHHKSLPIGDRTQRQWPVHFSNSILRSPGLAQPKTPSGQRNRKPGDVTRLTIFAIGHSTRPIDEFLSLLKAHGVQRVVDVRTIPRSRHNPQFNRDQLSPALHRRKIHYRHMPGLGGLRRARPDSANAGWRNASFRGYADYMQTPEFEDSLEGCIDLAKQERIVLSAQRR